MHGDGEKIVDPSKQEALSSVLKTELRSPLRVAVVNRGPDMELLVANRVELSRRGRPLVFYDITLALEILNSGIFSVLFQSIFGLSNRRSLIEWPVTCTLPIVLGFIFHRLRSGGT